MTRWQYSKRFVDEKEKKIYLKEENEKKLEFIFLEAFSRTLPEREKKNEQLLCVKDEKRKFCLKLDSKYFHIFLS